LDKIVQPDHRKRKENVVKKIVTALSLAVLALAVAVGAAVAGPTTSSAAKADIVETAVEAGQFTTLAALLEQAGLVSTLQSGTWTVFAPTDAAFAKVPKRTLDALAKNPSLLKQVLLYHVVKGNVPAADVVKLNGLTVETVSGLPVGIKIAGKNVFLNGSTKVTTPDVAASNGTIHVINKVLLPPGDIVATASASKSFDTLTALVAKAGLVKTLRSGTWTLFAPTDAAFAKVPKKTLAALAKNKAQLREVLLYHLVKGAVPSAKVASLDGRRVKTMSGQRLAIDVRGGKVFVNTSRVLAPDVIAANGVIHVVNRVLLPPA
jgi:uncharacterized surface protein with fasciclin (FAS1) repeats